MSHCPDSSDCRTTQDIVWGSLVTILASAWVTVHPAIPGQKEKLPAIISRRLGLFLLALLTPELVLLWSIRQWWLAGKIASEYELEGWTRTHGFFALMGGFIAYDGRRAIRPLFFDPDQQEDLELPEISAEDIEDRSKNNVISQLVITLQIVWFLSQCIARRVAGFEIPQLELIALNYVVLYAASSFFWWKKPFGVRRPVRVRVPKGWQSPWTPPHPEDIDTPSALCRIFDTFFGSFIRVAKGVRYPIRGSRMSSFYPEPISRSHMMWSSTIGTIITTSCGAIQLAAWSSEPMGHFRTLWRVASLITITIPIVSCFLAWISSHQESSGNMDDFVIFLAMPFLLFTVGTVYFVARGILIALAFRAMAYPPPSSFQTISWIKSFPHGP